MINETKLQMKGDRSVPSQEGHRFSPSINLSGSFSHSFIMCKCSPGKSRREAMVWHWRDDVEAFSARTGPSNHFSYKFQKKDSIRTWSVFFRAAIEAVPKLYGV